MSKNKVGVMIATPVKGWRGPESLPFWFKKELEELAGADSPYDFQLAVVDGGLVRARNKIAANFLASDARWILWWDCDIRAEVADVFKLLSHKLPIVGGLYATREEHPHWVANFLHQVFPQKHGLLQVLELGTGFKLMHRQVFENLARMYPGIAYTDRDTGERLHGFFQNCVLTTDLRPDGDLVSEDYFCDHLCRNAKIAIWCDTQIKLRHIAPDGTAYPKGDFPPVPVDDCA